MLLLVRQVSEIGAFAPCIIELPQIGMAKISSYVSAMGTNIQFAHAASTLGATLNVSQFVSLNMSLTFRLQFHI